MRTGAPWRRTTVTDGGMWTSSSRTAKLAGACAVSSGLRLWRGRRLRLHLDEGNAVAALHARDSQWLGSYGRFTKTTKTKLKNAWSYGAYLWWRLVVMNSAWLQGAVASTIFGDGSAPTKVPHSFLLTFSFFFLNLWLFFLLQGMKWRMWIFKKIRWAFRIRPGPWLFGPEIGFGYYKFYIYDLFSSYFFGSLYFFSYLSWAKSHLSSTRFTKLYKYYLFYKVCFCVFVQASL